jgi:hypoxanthine phosphoribosyltransferase
MKEFVRSHPRLLVAARKVRYRLWRLRVGERRVVTYEEGVAMARQLAKQLPNEYDVVIGIPRAGLIPATVLSEIWGRPLSTPDDFVNGVIWQSHNVPATQEFTDVREVRKVLVVDDGTFTGEVKREVLSLLEDCRPDVQVQLASLYTSEAGRELGVKALETRSDRNALEWSLMSSWWRYPGPPCTDLDGVLSLDGRPYLTHKLFDAVITARPESRRAETEAWLTDNRVDCVELLMLPDSTENTFPNVVAFKSKALKERKAYWYWESSDAYALAIRRASGVPVLSVEEMRLYA